MNSKTLLYYLGVGFQLIGISSVGLCFFGGLQSGDYNKIQLLQFVGGSFIFYLGHFLRAKA